MEHSLVSIEIESEFRCTQTITSYLGKEEFLHAIDRDVSGGQCRQNHWEQLDWRLHDVDECQHREGDLGQQLLPLADRVPGNEKNKKQK